MALKMVNNHHSFLSKMHCSASPLGQNDRSQVEAAMPNEHSYYYTVFFFAEEVPLPEGEQSADLKVCLPLRSLPPAQMYPDFRNVGFPSAAVEAACCTSRSLDTLACEVPLPSSPPLVDTVHHTRNTLGNVRFCPIKEATEPEVLPWEVALPPSPPPERSLNLGETRDYKHLDLQSTRFSSLDDEVAFYMSKPLDVMTHEVPLPPSPPPPDAEIDMGHHDKKKYPDLQNIGFPSLDDNNSDPMWIKLPPCVVKLPPSPPPSEGILPLIQLANIPLPPSPPPADDERDVGFTPEKKFPDLQNIGFLFLDDNDCAPKCLRLPPCLVALPPSPSPSEGILPLRQLADIPLPPSPPPPDAEIDTRHRDEKKYPDLQNIGFPFLDDNDSDPMWVKLSPCVVPLPPSPPPASVPHLAGTRYLDLSIVAFPLLT